MIQLSLYCSLMVAVASRQRETLDVTTHKVTVFWKRMGIAENLLPVAWCPFMSTKTYLGNFEHCSISQRGENCSLLYFSER